MQAITTKALKATNTHGTRIKAECERGSLTIPYPGSAGAEAHREAVRQLCAKFREEDGKKYGTVDFGIWGSNFVTGQSKDGNYQHVFVL